MGEPRRLVVVGASLAGLRSVEAARRAGFTGRITLVGAEEHLPYDRPPLSKGFLEAPESPVPTYRTAEQLRDLEVDLVLGQPASRLDPDARLLEVADRSVGYDALIIATGAAARELPGTSDVPGVTRLRTIDDARFVRSALDEGARTVVIGGGFIGSEVASNARKRGLPVTILEATHAPLARALGAEMGVAVSRLHALHGTDLRCGAAVSSISSLGLNGGGVEVAVDDGTVHAADLVVVGVGATPATDWLAGSGLVLHDGVVCDEALWTGLPGIYAAGDVARWPNALFGRTMRLEHWTSATEQAEIAVNNALGLERRTCATVPYFWSDWYGVRIQLVGVPAEDEVRVVTGSAEEGRFVALYREGDRLLGALCVGFPALTMKYRRLVAAKASWDEALEFAANR